MGSLADPHRAEDLPGYDPDPSRTGLGRSPVVAWFGDLQDRAVAWFQRDSLSAVAAAAATSFVLLVIMMAALRACGAPG